MPIYEYECKECGNVEEAFQKISDAPLEKCKKCQGRLNKIVSHSSFHLKGSGWYVTDYGGTPSKGDKSSKCETSSNDNNSSNKIESPCSSTCTQSCSNTNNKAE
ncbi:MAG: zinc ribbon domain-containing protein [Desulfamplus sp.]|nr:zinc ribbon domain-containing protein [Desulfamplus sp.]